MEPETKTLGAQMTDDEKAARRCAESIDWSGLGPGAIRYKPMAINQFLNGIAYARANPGPDVLGLVEALEQLADFTESFCEEVRVSKHYRSIENARLALDKWRSR